MRLPTLIMVVLAPSLFAQDSDEADALTSNRSRLHEALRQTGGLHGTTFAASWGPQEGAEVRRDGPARIAGPEDAIRNAFFGSMHNGVTGTWHRHVDHYVFEGGNDDEVLVTGRRSLARSNSSDWKRRNGRFADGTRIPFLPDIELLLRQLSSWQLALLRHETAMIDDKRLEIVTCTLDRRQIAEAAWSGMLPVALCGSGTLAVNFGGRAAQRGARARPSLPDAIVDLAITFDPATLRVHELRFRSYQKSLGGPGVGADKADARQRGTGAGMAFENGLPVRSRKQRSVFGFTVKLSGHGESTPPALTGALRTQLGI